MYQNNHFLSWTNFDTNFDYDTLFDEKPRQLGVDHESGHESGEEKVKIKIKKNHSSNYKTITMNYEALFFDE